MGGMCWAMEMGMCLGRAEKEAGMSGWPPTQSMAMACNLTVDGTLNVQRFGLCHEEWRTANVFFGC